MLIRALPADAPLWAALENEQTEAQKPTADRIRERAREFEAHNNRTREAPNG